MDIARDIEKMTRYDIRTSFFKRRFAPFIAQDQKRRARNSDQNYEHASLIRQLNSICSTDSSAAWVCSKPDLLGGPVLEPVCSPAGHSGTVRRVRKLVRKGVTIMRQCGDCFHYEDDVVDCSVCGSPVCGDCWEEHMDECMESSSPLGQARSESELNA